MLSNYRDYHLAQLSRFWGFWPYTLGMNLLEEILEKKKLEFLRWSELIGFGMSLF